MRTKMGTQWKSATLPDAVSSFYVWFFRIKSLSGYIIAMLLLGKTENHLDESEDLPVV